MKALVYQGKIVQIQEQSFDVHPNYQWFDCPNDCTLDWVFADGVISPPTPIVLSPEEVLALFQLEIKSALDEKARERQYDNALSITSYTSSTNAQWKAEADAFIAWRDAVFVYALGVLDTVQQGGSQPTVEEFIAGLPIMAWPN